MTLSAAELAPCPFCGKPGEIDEEQSKGNPGHVVFVPSCSDSDCIGVLIQSFARRSDAIAAWNRRSHSTPAQGEVQEVVKELRAQAHRTAHASQLLADAKSARNRAAGEPDASYAGLSPEQTLEWKAATLLSRLQDGRNEGLEEAARYHIKAADNAAAEHPGIQGSKSQKWRERFHRESAAAARALNSQPPRDMKGETE